MKIEQRLEEIIRENCDDALSSTVKMKEDKDEELEDYDKALTAALPARLLAYETEKKDNNERR